MVSRFEQKSKQTIIECIKVAKCHGREGSYWSNEFSCPTIAAFLHESVCENTEDVAGAGELVFDATDTETRTRRSPNHGQ